MRRAWAGVVRWFGPDHRKEALFAFLAVALLMPAAVSNRAEMVTGSAVVATNPSSGFAGTGMWADWTDIRGASPAFTSADIDRGAAQGIQTLYLQVARQSGGTPLFEPDRLKDLIARARSHGMRVIGWHLPALDGSARDVQVAVAAKKLGIDGYAIDVESRKGSATVRNTNLAALAPRLRTALGTRFPLGAIVLPPVLFRFVNPSWWGGSYPYASMAKLFDALLVMSYATDRKAPWNDSYVHAASDIAYLREVAGAGVRLHIIGGYGSRFTAAEAEKTARVAKEWCAIGVSIYEGALVSSEGWKDVADTFTRSSLPCRPAGCVDDGLVLSSGAFAPGGYALLPAADPTLVAVLAKVKAHSGPTVIHGYTDSAGAAADNVALSRRRAEAVRQWLVTRGAASGDLSVKAWGEVCPIRSNTTPTGRAANRRVVVHLS